jgi:5-methylcytosine-specific restriction endonuclease McrA
MKTETQRKANREYMQRWRAANPELAKKKAQKASAEYRSRHTEENKTYQREWAKKWREQNPQLSRDTVRMRAAIRKAKKYGGQGSYTVQEWQEVLEKQKYRCFYCNTQLTRETACQEHKIPLIRGGSSDISNVVASCHPCNHKKGRLTDSEFSAR